MKFLIILLVCQCMCASLEDHQATGVSEYGHSDGDWHWQLEYLVVDTYEEALTKVTGAWDYYIFKVSDLLHVEGQPVVKAMEYIKEGE